MGGFASFMTGFSNTLAQSLTANQQMARQMAADRQQAKIAQDKIDSNEDIAQLRANVNLDKQKQ